MKNLLFAIVFLSASAAFGQAGSISGQAQAIQFPDHPQHVGFFQTQDFNRGHNSGAFERLSKKL